MSFNTKRKRERGRKEGEILQDSVIHQELLPLPNFHP
jgi:hypothetical protein